ncbi:hypothetical protein ACFU6I_21610 [Streptomyces sp. NPDC057486]|uniref:hypothetical protein n=1 Tax=Streptomyces sp. NPDC057486 TaxID=3346145 RepID=UPI0036D062BD
MRAKDQPHAEDANREEDLLPEGVPEARAEQAAPVYARSVRDNVLAPLTTQEHEQLTAIGDKPLAHLDPEALPGAGEQEERP